MTENTWSITQLMLVGLAVLSAGFVLALAFFAYQSPEMAFWLDGFSLCN